MTREIILFWLGVSFYGAGSILAITGFIISREKLLNMALLIGALGLIPHGAAIIVRWIRVGHGPYMNIYEVISSNGWVAMFFYWIIQKKLRHLLSISVVVMPLIFLSMGFGLMFNSKDIPLPPSLRSYWLIAHIVFAKLSGPSFLIGFGSAVLYLYTSLSNRGLAIGKMILSSVKLDNFVYRFNALGFAFSSIMIIAGSIWANNAWGRYWAFDPVETWSLIVWLSYGLFLHLRLNKNWVGKRSAFLTSGIFALSILAFFVIPYFVRTVHSEYLLR